MLQRCLAFLLVTVATGFTVSVSLALHTNQANATAQLLSEIIRIDNSNPPGHERRLDDLLAAKLRPLGFEIEIVPTPEAGKAHLLARLRSDGSRKPILLAAHADTVGIERDKWCGTPSRPC